MSRYAALNGLLISNNMSTITASKDNEVLITDLTARNEALEERVLELEREVADILDIIDRVNVLPPGMS
jgi:uncharacterized protein YceH (UPF0502 family)